MAEAGIATMRRQPRGPVLRWGCLWPARLPDGMRCLLQAPQVRLTSSGRAALWHALRALQLAPGTEVLVPTYHCPTMIAPVVLLGLQPRFYPLNNSGLPALDRLSGEVAARSGAIIVPHLFGRTQSLAAVRQWCDTHRVPLIEDCAHALMGQAGDRQAGAWGDFAIASLTKFLPVPEAGVLASWHRALPATPARAPGLRQQVKAWVDVLERRPDSGAVGRVLAGLRRLRGGPSVPSGPADAGVPDGDAVKCALQACDMARVDQRPTVASRLLAALVSLGAPARRRRSNFARFQAQLAGIAGVRPLWGELSADAAPYVFPLWVAQPDELYARLREKGMAVLRWDRVWPGAPTLDVDAGAEWRHHVLQLLCHQDLDDADIDDTAQAIRAWQEGAAA